MLRLKISQYLLLVISIVMMCLTMALIPFCDALWILTIVLAIMGFFMGTIDTVANVSMIRIYGKDVSPFLQALHFFYGVGAFISPMIAQPFLLNEDCTPLIDNTSEPVDTLDPNDTLQAKSLEEAQRMTQIDYAFWIMSALMVPVVILSLTLLGKDIYLRMFGMAGDINQNKQDQYENPDDAPPVPAEEKFENTPVSTFRTVLVTLLCAGLMFLYDGLQAIYGGYLYSYAVKGPVKLKRSYAAYLNALFWGMFAMGRLLSIALATRLTPVVMLMSNITGCTVGMLLMLIFIESKAVLVMGTCIIGLFMSSVFPTALSLTEDYIKVTPTITTFLVFGAALGEMSMPVIVGHEFHRNKRYSFLLIGLSLCLLSLFIFRTLILVGDLIIRRSTPRSIASFIKSCFSTKGATEGEDTGLTTQHVRYYSRMEHDDSENNINQQQYTESSFTENKPQDTRQQ